MEGRKNGKWLVDSQLGETLLLLLYERAPDFYRNGIYALHRRRGEGSNNTRNQIKNPVFSWLPTLLPYRKPHRKQGTKEAKMFFAGTHEISPGSVRTLKSAVERDLSPTRNPAWVMAKSIKSECVVF